MILIITGFLAVCMINKSEGYEEVKSIQLAKWGESDDDLGLNDNDKKKTQVGDGRDIFDFSELPESAGPATNSDIAGYFEGSVLHLEPGKTDGISCTDESNNPGTAEWRIGMDEIKSNITYSDKFNFKWAVKDGVLVKDYDTDSPLELTLGPRALQLLEYEYFLLKDLQDMKGGDLTNSYKIDTLLTCKMDDNNKKCPIPYDINSDDDNTILINTLNTCNKFMYPKDGSPPPSPAPAPPIDEINISDSSKSYKDENDFGSSCCLVQNSPDPNYCNYTTGWLFDIFIFLILILICKKFQDKIGWVYSLILIISFLLILLIIGDMGWVYWVTRNDERDCNKPHSLYHWVIYLLDMIGINYEWIVAIIYPLLIIILIGLIILIIREKPKNADDMEAIWNAGGVPGDQEFRATDVFNAN